MPPKMSNTFYILPGAPQPRPPPVGTGKKPARRRLCGRAGYPIFYKLYKPSRAVAKVK